MEIRQILNKLLTQQTFSLLLMISLFIKGNFGVHIIEVNPLQIYSKVDDSIFITYTIADSLGAEVPIPLAESLIEINVKTNTTSTRICTIKFDTSSPVIRYDFDDTSTIKRLYKDRIIVTYTSAKVSFSLKNLTTTDFGRAYDMTYIYSKFDRPSGDVKLIQAVKPSITNGTLFPRQSLVRGSNGEYRCYADGVPIPQVKWYRNSTLLASGNKMASFSITEGKIEDTDTYTCQASNPGGVTTKDMLLEIAYIELRDDIPLKTISVVIGGSINEPCEIIGYPGIERTKEEGKGKGGYTWVGPTSETVGSDRILVYGNMQNNERVNDYGNYTCTGTNGAGSLKYTVQVLVKEDTATTAPSQGGDSSGGKFIEASIFVVFIIYVLSILSLGLL